jgi:alanine racemase
VTGTETTLGLVPLGYNEGIPRTGTNTAPVFVRGRRLTVAGTVCMNLCVVDAGDVPVEAGDEVVLFGPGDHGEPTAQEWADLLGTVSYDIVTRFTGKIPRSYCGVTETDGAGDAVAGAGVTAVPPAAARARDASDHAEVARLGGQEV